MTLDDSIRAIVREEVQAALRTLPSPRAAGEWLSTEEAAEVVGVRPKTVRAWVAEGLPAQRRGRRLVISRKALESWVSASSPTGAGILASLTPPASHG